MPSRSGLRAAPAADDSGTGPPGGATTGLPPVSLLAWGRARRRPSGSAPRGLRSAGADCALGRVPGAGSRRSSEENAQVTAPPERATSAAEQDGDADAGGRPEGAREGADDEPLGGGGRAAPRVPADAPHREHPPPGPPP